MIILLQFRYFNGINNKFYYTALHFAVENNNIEIAKLLLENSTINTSLKNKILSSLDFFDGFIFFSSEKHHSI